MIIRCQYCGRFLGKADGVTICVIKCSNSKCKKDNRIKIVNSDATLEQIRFSFDNKQSDIMLMTNKVQKKNGHSKTKELKS